MSGDASTKQVLSLPQPHHADREFSSVSHLTSLQRNYFHPRTHHSRSRIHPNRIASDVAHCHEIGYSDSTAGSKTGKNKKIKMKKREETDRLKETRMH